MELRFFTDPGHGWLRVHLADLGDFVPSPYSYRDSEYAYLEEDCDAPDWAKAANRWEEARNCSVTHTDNESPIRRKSSF